MKKSDVYGKIIEEHENRCANPHIGVIIKKRRKDLNMTLEDVTKGICCVSYLSKLEHGTISPKEYVMKEVLERLDMSENNLRTKNEYLSIIIDCLYHLYYENNEGIKNYFDNLASLEKIHYSDIIKAIYYYSVDNIELSKKYIDEALVVKGDLDDIELNACVIMSALISEKEEKYGEALEIIKKIDHRFMENVEINKLRLMIKCRLNLIVGNYVILCNDLVKLQECCYNTIDFKGMIIIKEQLGISLAYSGNEIDALELYKSIKTSIGIKSANILLKEIYKALKKPSELLKNCKTNEIDKLWAYNLLKEENTCLNILKQIKLEEIYDSRQRLFVQAMMKKYYENEYFYIGFLREIYYPYALEHSLYEDAKDMKEQLVKFYTADAKYKDALKVIRDFEKIFK